MLFSLVFLALFYLRLSMGPIMSNLALTFFFSFFFHLFPHFKSHLQYDSYLLAGDIELLRFLLSKGVDIDSQSDAGTPLIWAAGHGQHDAVKVLLEHHANVRSCFLVSLICSFYYYDYKLRILLNLNSFQAYVFTLHPIFYEDRYCSKYLELAVSLLPHVQ